MIRVLTCVAQQHDLRLVALSALICALGCFATVNLMIRVDAGEHWILRRLVPPAIIFGGSVWSLHFVAMLAFRPGAQVAYDLDLTAASIVVAIVGSLAALCLWRRLPSTPLGIVTSGTVLGLAITGMHYLGVGAMTASSLVLFDPVYVAASILVSIAFSALALARAGRLTSLGRRLEVSGYLALAICGLHFTGMTAVTMAPITPREGESYVLGSTPLALTVAAVSLAVLIAGLVALALQQHLSQRDRRDLSRMRLLSNLAHEVLFIHRDGEVLEVNDAGARLFAMPSEQIIGRPVLDLFSQADTPALLRRTRCRSEELLPEEFEIRTAAGTHVPVELSCRTIEFGGKPATAVALRDLTDRKRDEARIRHLALHDALTDLPNRYLLEQRLGPALDVAASDGTGVAVIYLDLDRFKAVNDLHGHAAGDALLVQATKRMLTELRPTDTLARVGGDEFVVVLTGARAPQRVAEIAGRLIEGLRRPFRIDDHRVEIGASAGVALYPGDGSTAESLLRAADTALYRVKDEGRGAVRFFEAAMDAQLQARQRLEHELGGAIDRDELRLFYQPIVNARTGEIETFEALIRWQHPERGFVSPAEFIPVAEQADLIGRIGEWVIDTACAAAAAWPQPWRVSVNVSPTQFRQSDVPALVAAALARHGLAPARLVVEITESVFIQDASAAVAVLTRLRELGVRLALDDFGTGYSSLSYLQQFRFDKIKVDQSFVRRLGQHADTLAIVRAIVNLGHNLGLQVTVEGVETAEQLVILRELHCEQMQGYLFARPAATLGVSELELARLRALFAEPLLRALA
ncbi:EAL domain-containing protein [Methylobacterium mesophilicum SR1.6/6]|uniref:EAL domain-containing protein n=1 Tax=Methylobacterium mesophilicum SR1.6/6 TaxID=908290 RepID=A0A6B9FRD5_9HYPH|nr:EAL domain-containing protein [Methylobacterium mesophilicum]QGY03564.1 EAL domain-containing protein [Methylobacterium mesophilicum SR1.6/6]